MCKRCYKTALPGQSLCETHAAQPQPTRVRNELRKLYKCKRWYVTRAHVLARDPVCTWTINGESCPRLSTACDHILDAVQWVEKGGDFYDMDNLRGLCHPHHSERTAKEQGFAQGKR